MKDRNQQVKIQHEHDYSTGQLPPVTTHGGKRKGSGRKAIEIDRGSLEKLGMLQCTEEEIGAFLEVSVRTIRNRMRDPDFAAVVERGRAKGRISVRRAQMRLLDEGNASIAIWLGKQLLKQRDNIQLNGPSNPTQITVEVIDGILDRATKNKKSR